MVEMSFSKFLAFVITLALPTGLTAGRAIAKFSPSAAVARDSLASENEFEPKKDVLRIEIVFPPE